MATDNSEFADVLYHAARHYGGTFRKGWERSAAPGDLNELLWGELPAAEGTST